MELFIKESAKIWVKLFITKSRPTDTPTQIPDLVHLRVPEKNQNKLDDATKNYCAFENEKIG